MPCALCCAAFHHRAHSLLRTGVFWGTQEQAGRRRGAFSETESCCLAALRSGTQVPDLMVEAKKSTCADTTWSVSDVNSRWYLGGSTLWLWILVTPSRSEPVRRSAYRISSSGLSIALTPAAMSKSSSTFFGIFRPWHACHMRATGDLPLRLKSTE